LTIAHDFFCGVGACWLGDSIDGIWAVGSVLTDFVLKLAPIFGLIYLLYWIWLVIRTVKEGSPEPIINHVMLIWQIITAIAHAIISLIKFFTIIPI